jgi:hypothetical protein
LIAPGRSVGQPRVLTFLKYLAIFYLNRSIIALVLSNRLQP